MLPETNVTYESVIGDLIENGYFVEYRTKDKVFWERQREAWIIYLDHPQPDIGRDYTVEDVLRDRPVRVHVLDMWNGEGTIVKYAE